MTPDGTESAYVTVSVEIGPAEPWYRMAAQPGGWQFTNPDSDPLYPCVENLEPEDVAEEIGRRLVDRDLDGMWKVRSVRRDPAAVAAEVCGVECTERPEDMPPGAQMMRVGTCKLPRRHEGMHDPKLGVPRVEVRYADGAEPGYDMMKMTCAAMSEGMAAVLRHVVEIGAKTGQPVTPEEVYRMVVKSVLTSASQTPEGPDVMMRMLAVVLAEKLHAEALR